jgi:dipeptidase D
MSNSIRTLEPKSIWNHFSDINEIPRGSKKEEKITAFMKEFGESLSLETIVDKMGNVIIKKPGTPGMENRKATILQSHLDMVHQKNEDTQFDFDSQGIDMFVEGEWVKARGTTLGSDNGIGVAAIMSILASDNIAHPAIEALFTIDEETGMTGAKGLEDNILSGSVLLNLDSEEITELTIGCAGGLDTSTVLYYREEGTPSGHSAFEISLKGLKGGHSGIDIHLGRGNANKLMNRILHAGTQKFDLHIAEIDGGGLRNAIPREARSVVTIPGGQVEMFTRMIKEISEMLQDEYKYNDPDLAVACYSVALPEKVMEADVQNKIVRSLYAIPNGVFRMTPNIPGLVETSSNLARVIAKDGVFRTKSLQRSSTESGKQDIAQAVRATFELIDAEVTNSGDYPGWAPDLNSEILSIVRSVYENVFDVKPTVLACHAGLECGIIGRRYPGLDMISIGPTIKNPHSPDESVQVHTVQKFWTLLKDILKEIPLEHGN